MHLTTCKSLIRTRITFVNGNVAKSWLHVFLMCLIIFWAWLGNCLQQTHETRVGLGPPIIDALLVVDTKLFLRLTESTQVEKANNHWVSKIEKETFEILNFSTFLSPFCMAQVGGRRVGMWKSLSNKMLSTDDGSCRQRGAFSHVKHAQF
uniref:Uncharacterized protein n=1 Tax=Strigamia maritima TaxID=126957 RepID=T1IW18_STRMM